MSVKAIGEYHGESRDRLENFNGIQLVYLQWDKHLLFCSPFTLPVPPTLRFSDFLEQTVTPALASHFEARKIDFKSAQWTLNGHAFVPQLELSLLEQGIDHKSFLKLSTPGLIGLNGTCN